MGFIETFQEASKGSESPASYWYWASIAALSGIIKRNVYVQRPSWKTYPNLFIFLVGESGLRKGPPINLARDVVSGVNNTRVISGRSSVQGIISKLGTAYTLPDGTIIDKSYGYISASELASSFVRDQDSLTILTDLYDSCYHPTWEDTLRGGHVKLIEPYVTLLGGINPPHFEDFISTVAVEGGFVARVLMIFEHEKACINPAVRKSEFQVDQDELQKKLITQAKLISKVKGEMQWTEEALIEYENWYKEFEEGRKKRGHKDRTGSINRVGENILKVAIIMSLSRSTENVLRIEDIRNSMTACLTSLASVNKTTAGQGKSQFAPQTKLVLTELINAKDHEISRTRILGNNWGSIDATDLDRVIDTLVQAGGVEQFRKGSDICYRLTKKAISQLEI